MHSVSHIAKKMSNNRITGIEQIMRYENNEAVKIDIGDRDEYRRQEW